MKEKVSASKKLGKSDAREIYKASSRIVIVKGKKLTEAKGGAKVDNEVLDAMLGSTGNLRAPLIRTGKTTLVGFNEAVYDEVFP